MPQSTDLTLSELWIYPVKGCAGIFLQSAQIGPRGFVDDRAWMVVDEAGRFVSQRTHRAMAQIQVTLTDHTLDLAAPGQPPLSLPRHAVTRRQAPVRIWNDLCQADSMGPMAAAWLSNLLQMPCELVHMPTSARRLVNPAFAGPQDVVGFADGFPYLLVTEASLAELNSRLDNPVPISRFRGNMVVRGGVAWDEDSWRRVQVGTATFRVAKECGRCVVINVDQSTAQFSREPLQTLSTYRRRGKSVVFGQNLLTQDGGWLHVGDAIQPAYGDSSAAW